MFLSLTERNYFLMISVIVATIINNYNNFSTIDNSNKRIKKF